MLTGIEAMRWEQLVPAAAMVGIPARETTRLGSAEKLRPRLVRAVGELVSCPSRSPDDIERDVLSWMASHWDVQPREGETLEDAIFSTLSEEITRYLMPVWKVSACMALLGVAASRQDELHSLERVAQRMVPSSQARAHMRREWEALATTHPVSANGLLERVQAELLELRRRDDLIQPTLTLCMVVALADGKLEREETRLFEGVASRLEVGGLEAMAIKERVHHAFWQCRSNIAPPTTEQPDEIRSNSLRAAQLTLEQQGVLGLLERDVQDGCLTGLHQTLFVDRDFQRGLKGWNRAPLLWPIGFPVGTLVYLRERFQQAASRHVIMLALMAYAADQQQNS